MYLRRYVDKIYTTLDRMTSYMVLYQIRLSVPTKHIHVIPAPTTSIDLEKQLFLVLPEIIKLIILIPMHGVEFKASIDKTRMNYT